ncbi:hypothetical protein [Methylobacterium sp. Leaf88]|uniref:hypothetical protein n=1 Tax=Methylobacterium sp. Leaf88 TaxID=1736244 RepID=UPI0012E86567|nr:hypothetical protein [Methylobacterium sp. Leaf88]
MAAIWLASSPLGNRSCASTHDDRPARRLIRDAETTVHANLRRALCVLAERHLRDLQARGIDPRAIVEGYGTQRRVQVERDREDVRRGLRHEPEAGAPRSGCSIAPVIGDVVRRSIAGPF